MAMKVIASNKRARFDYDITERLVAGIVLTGAETKSIKLGHVSLKGSFVSLQKSEAYLNNVHVTPYQNASAADHLPDARRKLLLHRRQLTELETARQAGLSVVAMAIGQDRGLVKVELGIGRGKRRYDKRASLKTRQASREVNRAIKGRLSK